MAENQDLMELYKQHQAAEDKYTYFLLAAAAAAIAFAVQKTDGATLSWWLLPVAFAAGCWALSFFFGCKHITWVQTALYANYSLLQLKEGVHPDQPPPALLTVAESGVRKALASNVDKAQFYGQCQFRMLILGAVFFIGWHIAEITR
ncbi:MAG: hypothetical protein HYX43_04670 [Burkholderiales bacterium]|nr:hypothetical protein [Burkholderiales bacterium]